MQTSRRIRLLILAVSFVTASLPAVAQVVTATLPAGVNPYSVAVNSVTNTMYAVNDCGNDPTCNSLGTVTVINGANNSTASVNVGAYPYVAAVNSVTNKIYVANQCGTDLTCNSVGTVTVIDGTTNNIVATVTTGYYPYALAVNATTNMIYVANDCGNDSSCSSPGTVTVINANDNYSTSTINVANNCGNTCNDPGSVTVGFISNRDWEGGIVCPVNHGHRPRAFAMRIVAASIRHINLIGHAFHPVYLDIDTVATPTTSPRPSTLNQQDLCLQ